MKKTILIIVIIIVILVSIIGGIFYINKRNNEILKIFPAIKEQIESKSKVLLVVTNTDGTCDTCKDATKFVEYYKDLYNLDVLYFDKKDASVRDNKELLSYFKLEEEAVSSPAVIIIKDKQWLSVVNSVQLERDLKNFLSENEFINQEELEKEKQITKFELDPVYNSEEANLILFYSSDDKSYNYRKQMLKLSEEYNFKYNIFHTVLFGAEEITDKFKEEKKIDIKSPSIAIVQNGDIIAYNDSDNESEIINFLKENSIIK